MRNSERILGAYAIVLGILGLTATASPAQEAPHLHSVALRGVPLQRALEYVIDRTNIDLVYESSLVRERTTFCKIEQANEKALLACVLQGTGVDFVRLSSGTYVLRLDVRQTPKKAGMMGQILDADTGTPVAGAHVLIADARSGTATNLDGRFAVAGLLPGRHHVIVSHVAYQTQADSIWVSAHLPNRVSISIEPRIVAGEPIVITGRDLGGMVEPPGLSRRSARSLERPNGVGSPDVIQEIGNVTGVRLGELESEVHIQGGASNEQQFVLDGMPIFVPISSGGFIGPFSPFAIEQVTIRKAGFGADYGSHLSGVVELDHRLGSEGPSALTLQADALAANGRWDGRHRLSPDVESFWMIAGRSAVWDTYHPPQLENLYLARSKPDLFLSRVLATPDERPVVVPVADATHGELEVSFTDLHGAARLRFGGLRSLKLAFYRGANAFGIDSVLLPNGGGVREFEDAYRWSNRALEARYEWVATGRLFMSAETWMSGYELVHPVSPTEEMTADRLLEEFNEFRESGVRARGDLALSGSHDVSGALEVALTRGEFALSLDPLGRTTVGPESVRPVRYRVAGFVQDRIRLSSSSALELGSRLTYLPERSGLFAEPRAAFEITTPIWSTRAAVGLYRQFLHAFDVATYNVASLLPHVRFWLPLGHDQRPPEVYHVMTAFTYRPASTWEITGEAYYKHQPHLLVLDYTLDVAPEKPFEGADGFAYGFGASLTHRKDPFRVEASYEFAVSKRRIPGRFDDAYLHTPWHAPHHAAASVDVTPLAAVTLSARWQAAIGREWGFRQAYYDFLATDPRSARFGDVDLTEPEKHRLPVYTQIDVGLAYQRDIGPASIQARLTLVNLLDRRNVTDWSLRYEESSGTYVRDARLGVPFVPVGSLRISLY